MASRTPDRSSLGSASPRAGRRAGPPERVGALVPSVLRDLGLDESVRALRIQESWERAVGAEVASHARPATLRNGVLEVQADSSVWCQTLRLRAPELLGELTRALGADAPHALWFRLAESDGILRR
jgi:predicted nucleic acid-binding Zn ribbon protein